MHWIVPIYKTKAIFQPGNYRGVHLTAQLSKVMERFLGQLWLPELVKEPKFLGPISSLMFQKEGPETPWRS